MEKTVSGNMVELVDRRLHPVRLGIGHLNKILETAKGGSVTMDRSLLVSITSTMEIFIEDFEQQYLGGRSMADDKKTVDSKVADSPRVTQTRVG